MHVLIIDDHPLFRQGVCSILQQMDSGCVCIEAENWRAGKEMLKSGNAPDLVLLDIKLPDINGIDALKLLRTSHPILPVVMLSASDDPAIMRSALDVGALGFLPKSSTNEVIVKAIQLVLAGGIYVPPEALSPAGNNEASATVNKYEGDFSITRRQAEVMDLIIQGQPNKIIADKLGLSENTVRGHVSAIFKILGVTNRTEAAYAIAKAANKNGND